MNLNHSIGFLTSVFFIVIFVQCNSKPVKKKKEVKEVVKEVVFSVKEKAVTDIDGNVYSSVVIDGNEWMTSNLKVTKFNDGTPIEYAESNENWNENRRGRFYCWVNNDITLKDEYGAYYNYYSVESGKLCPEGWHVPSKEEWVNGVLDYTCDVLKDERYAQNLRSPKDWDQYLRGTDKYKLNVLPSGYREVDGKIEYFKRGGGFWTSTQKGGPRAIVFLDDGTTGIRFAGVRRIGQAVRCVKDK